MGVSGSGKSHIGQQLAATLGATFIDGDDHHSPANVAKMASGTPLNDDDRRDWLATLAMLFAEFKARGESVVIACSGLKRRYRDRLRKGDSELRILYLEGTHELLRKRLETRAGHFFKGDNMLASQLADLEPPQVDEAVTLPISLTPAVIVERFSATLAPTPRRSLG
ncbi:MULTISPECIES: gluconokinase [Halomonadaceae]|jgi:gluconokinase|uniref:Gluconokinase n=1 Tax=Vreelandella piezotolerans TaxID=2609667 RepID=A0ABQ6XE68_9GAMM|nr:MULTISPECIES: gluconokinase [Halomonas]KAE8440259.1 gluconokinase [Halomonas piezotolerans]MCG7576622.1 gluconokinase [Halomonas sp. MMH1-48]MCG7589443.1 gluconokinase [Halomonas sp. McD50-5]MCG7603685.1 gluconokinase [Halomonas sp. MM17-34]MCG7612843.1 gluconokinase [Halomonas sp. MM17-29]